MLATLAFPWFVHAAVVALSALGARPLAGRALPAAILLSGAVFAAVLVRRAQRGERVAAEPSSQLSDLSRHGANALYVAGVCAFALSLALAFALPVIAYDALGYRLPVIAQWLDAGRVAWVISDDPVRNGYPLGQEAVSAVLVAATGSMRIASATSFLFVAAGASSIAALAEAWGVRASLARAAAALFVLAPITILNAPSGYVDAAFAGAVIALLCTAGLLLLRPNAWLASATGMAAAHVLALKGTGVAFVVVVAGCVKLALVYRGYSAWRADRAAPRTWLRFARPALLGLVCMAPGAFWILRNVVHTGNPLWPVEVRVAGHLVFRGVASMDAILSAASNTPPELARLPEVARIARVWLQLHGPAVDFDDRLAGLGWTWPFAALPALVLCLRSALGARAQGNAHMHAYRSLAFLALMTLGCFALQPLRWWPRYALWLWGVGALALALSAEGLARAGRERVLGLLLGLVMVMSLIEATVALIHAKGLQTAATRLASSPRAERTELGDVRRAPNAASWVAPSFWALGFGHVSPVCRGAWKPATDNANLDGVLAQLEPRPRVYVVSDDDGNWPRVRHAWQVTGCSRLLLLSGSPVLSSARRDPDVYVEPSVAFDPLFVVGPRNPGRFGQFEGSQP